MDNDDRQALLRRLPKVDQLLLHGAMEPSLAAHPRSMVVAAVQQVVSETRARILDGGSNGQDLDALLTTESHLERAREVLREWSRPTPIRVINATGIIVNTGLGRSLISERAARRMFEAATRHSALEVDVASGERGSRDSNLSGLICRLTGAEAATVVNNNAGAVLIALNALAEGREVIVSRGELVEIGGSFRIPDVMHKSGCRLVEVGTTNKTRAADYEAAINENTALLLKAHTSNFRIVGFHEELSLAELVEVGRVRGVRVMEDLGSGAFVDLAPLGIGPEPLVQHSLATGADVVTFSGDKLLGGPQAGLLAGRKHAIQKIRRNPLYRALRCDKVTIAGLEETLRAYLDPERAVGEIPTLRAIARPVEEVRRQARSLARRLRSIAGSADVAVERNHSQVGGGALPTEQIPTYVVAIRPSASNLQNLAGRLRMGEPSVFARVQNEALLLDMRTVLPEEVGEVAEAVRRALA